MVKKAVKVVAPLIVSGGLILWLFHKVDFHRVMTIIHEGVDYRYIVAMMLLTIASHIIRGIRWGIQLRAVGIPRMSIVAESVAIFGAYALNIVFPYLGEAWRCVYISRREGAKLSTVVGTDLGDRASDGLMISLLIILAVVVAHPAMKAFLGRYSISHAASHPAIITAAIAIPIILIATAIALRHSSLAARTRASISRIWQGFVVLFHLRDFPLYLILTVGIWACYFLETYSCFYAFPFTRELISQPGSLYGLIPGLVVFVFGSCSMIVPSNGGLGPWNIAIIFALSLYSIPSTEGAAYSIVCWSFQAMTLIALGIFSAIYIASSRQKGRKTENTNG